MRVRWRGPEFDGLVESVEDHGYETPCWIGYGWPKSHGYLMANVGGGQHMYAHRAAYIAWYGDIPDGLHIDHLCRNRMCVRPDHLEPVTVAENTRRGIRVKLDAEKVREIRASSEGCVALAKRYGVSHDAIISARKGSTWADVT